jgi:hypothetical protein
MLAVAFAGGRLAIAPATVAAQGGAPTVRLALESAFETAAASGPSVPVGASRLHADLSKQRATARSSVGLWSGLTAEQPWIQASRGSLAGALSVDGRVTLSRRNSFTFSQQVSSGPTDVFASLGSGTPAATSRAVRNGSELPGASRTTAESGRVALMRKLDARSQVWLAGAQSVSKMGSDGVASTGVSAGFFRQHGSHTGWHLGYGFVKSTSRTSGSTIDDQRHDLDVGVDYARPLTFSRHTTISVTTGSTVLTGVDGQHFRLNAAVALSHQLSPRWALTANYSRPIEYVAGFTRPLISDAVRAGLAGMLPHRISVQASAGGARGAEARAGGARFASYAATVRLTRRLSPVWALEGEYHDAWYGFDSDPQAVGIPPVFARRGFRTGIVWAPGGRQASGIDSVKGGARGARP